jgi:hypothetical protein
MLARRSLLVLIGGGLVAASTALTAQAAPDAAVPAGASDVPGSVADVSRNLVQPPAAQGPREMQYYIVRRRTWIRRTWVRRYYVRPRRFAWRCWSNGYSRYCRWRTI